MLLYPTYENAGIILTSIRCVSSILVDSYQQSIGALQVTFLGTSFSTSAYHLSTL
jgi:hypothetical protein